MTPLSGAGRLSWLLGLSALVAGSLALALPGESGHRRPSAGDAWSPKGETARPPTISVESLAGRLERSGVRGLTLLDLRSAAEFDEYHIPGAIRLTTSGFYVAAPESAGVLVAYDRDGSQGWAAWEGLRARGYQDVIVLEGGIAAWRNRVAPVPSPSASTGRDEPAGSADAGASSATRPVQGPSRRVAPRDSTTREDEEYHRGPGGCFN